MDRSHPKKPNILLILSDDQGAWAMGCAGNREIRTPNLDRLAGTGMRFENFFCTSPVCSPARASILTGRIPSQHGIHDWLSGGNVGDGAIEYLRGQPAYTDYLAENGYRCALSGKWHLGDSVRPQKSFTRWYVHQKGGGPYYNAPMIRDGKLYEEPGYVTDRITDEALRYLDEWGDESQPFYLGIHYTAPHSPWIGNHPKEIVDSYDDCPFETCPQGPLHPWHGSLTDEVQKDIRGNLKGYFAAVTAMDANIGRVIRRLEERGLRENTLVCFLSDNGFSCGQHGFWGKGNGTFPLNMYDTSVKVPAIFSHPGLIPQGTVCDALVSQYDFMPTLLDYAGIAGPDPGNLPGKSFLPLLRGGGMEENESVVIFDEYGPVRMIRSREFKYIHRYPYGPNEFYDLKKDPEERENLIGVPSVQAEISAFRDRLDRWFCRYVRPELDGSHQAVYGKGQDALTGPEGHGAQAFRGSD